MYRPFIDDPAHIALLDGQRYVVLRVIGAVSDAYKQVQERTKQELVGLPVSYPAQPHLTLAGFAKGTPVDAVRELVAAWAVSIPPLEIASEGVAVFPAPSQIVIVQVRKTLDLFNGLLALIRFGGQVNYAV